MSRKYQKKLVFKISQFSIRNYITYANFIILITVLLAGVIGFGYAFWATPKYQASGVLENQPYGSVSSISLTPITSGIQEQSNIINQIDLIKTHDVLSKVVHKLFLNIDIRPVTFPVFGGIYHQLQKDEYFDDVATGQLNKWFGVTGEAITFSQFQIPTTMYNQPFRLRVLSDNHYSLKLPTGKILNGVVGQKLIDHKLDINIELSRIFGQTNEQYDITVHNPEFAISKIEKGLVLDIPNTSNKQGDAKSWLAQNLIEVSYISRNPYKATAIVNSVLKEAVLASQNRKEKEASFSEKILELQSKVIQRTIALESDKISELRSEYRPLDPRAQSSYYSNLLLKLQENIDLLLQEKVKLTGSLTQKNPKVIDIEAQILTLKAKLSTLKKEVDLSPINTQDIDKLQVKLLANQEVLTKLTNQIGQLQAMKEAAIGDLQLVQNANPPVNSITYSRLILILLALGIGLIIGYVLSLVIA
ncbi:Wzz/FepE/Etk N-terminal domain-containing protein [Francisellaceae bacterium]|nr:Wzz/FepE/Etk N-terminal domain-containing protein [Francisellaceae bacterium]